MKKIPILDLKREYKYMKTGIDQAIRQCLGHQQWILGPEVKEFEDKVAKYIRTSHCIGVSSGTDALVLSLRALAIKTKGKEYFDRGDKIITTPFTFTATADAILRSGATPIFVDIDPATFNIDPLKIEACLKVLKGVVGIIPVHLYGQSCDMDAIKGLAKKKRLFVVEDAAQSFGGMWNKKKLGSIGDVGVFSFFPSKNLGCFGDGGMVSTNDAGIADIVRQLLKHGGKDKYNVNHIGYNARLDTVQAAVLLAKFSFLDELNEKRIAISRIYQKALSDIPDLVLPSHDRRVKHVFNQYTLRVGGGKRDALAEHLQQKGITTMVYYPVPLHKMKVFENRSIIFDHLKQVQQASHEVLSLPIEPLFEEAEILLVVEEIRKFFKAS